MAISVTPTFQGGNKDIDEIITFHDTASPQIFYQETNVPFAITLLSCHPQEKDKIVISNLSPDSQYNYAFDASVKGRVADSMHQHNHFEFMYIVNGSLYQIVEGRRFYYVPGSCCLLNRNTLHTEEYTTDFTCIFFSVSIDFVPRLTNYGHLLLFEKEQNPSGNLIFHFLENNVEETHENAKDFLDFVPRISETQQKIMVHDIFEQMMKTLLTPYYGATYRLQDLFCQLIDILSDTRYYNVQHVTTRSSMDSLLFARIDQLLEERNGRVTNHELAGILHYDGSYLGRIVKKFTGKSLFDYGMTFTMAAAGDMLKNTTKNVSQIAEELRFSNRTHFYKVFEKYYHMTPLQYRKSVLPYKR
jgi:AraC-like DNA-binding protein/mannose-6-phosphate isomerase-like protein (cupin superfamily)